MNKIFNIISSKSFTYFIILNIINFFLVIFHSNIIIYLYDFFKTDILSTDKTIYYILLSTYVFVFIFFLLKLSKFFKIIKNNNILSVIINFNIIFLILIFGITFYLGLNSNLFYIFFYSLPLLTLFFNYILGGFNIKEDYVENGIDFINNKKNILNKGYINNKKEGGFAGFFTKLFSVDEDYQKQNEKDITLGKNIFDEYNNIDILEDKNNNDGIENYIFDDIFEKNDENNNIRQEINENGIKKDIIIEDIDIDDIINDTNILDNEFDLIDTDSVDQDGFLSIEEDDDHYFNETDDDEKIEEIEDEHIQGNNTDYGKYHIKGFSLSRVQDVELAEKLLNLL